MIVAVNDISFLWGCTNKYAAKEKLIQFCNLLLVMKEDKVSNVRIPFDLVSSDSIYKDMEIAPGCTLIQAMYEIKRENKEMFNYLLCLLTQCGDGEVESDTFYLENFSSKHIAKYKDCFFVSLRVDEKFENELVEGCINKSELCVIKNLSKECHLERYWQELGIRRYELNPKHGKNEYIRSGGHKVGEAPETDELGQYLVNHAVEVQGNLYAVDDHGNRIFEIKRTVGNIFHAFCIKDISRELEEKIRRASNEKY